MFALNFLIPIIISYIAWIPYKKENDVFKKSKTHIISWVTVVCVLLAQMFLYMDFGTILSFSLLQLLSVAIVSVFFTLIAHGTLWLCKTKSFAAALLVFFGVALCLEITLFNFRFYQTADYEPVDVTEKINFLAASSDDNNEDNVYKFVNTYVSLRISDVDMKVNNVYLDITGKDNNGDVENIYAEISFTDESNTESLIYTPKQTVMAEVESTKYLYLMTNGEAGSVYITISTDYAKTYQIDGVFFNVSKPFNFSVIRIITVFLLLLIFWILRPSSKLWRYFYNEKSINQKTVTVLIVCVQIFLLFGLSLLNPIFYGHPAYHTKQYQQLADSFMDGKLYLEDTPPEFLAEMDNPYDYGARTEAAAENGQTYYWDAAYYEGRYYVYFGVIPVLLLYLPFKALTGMDLPNIAAINIFMVFFVIGSFWLIGKIIKRYFANKRIPYLAYLILSLIFVNASCGVFIAKRPDFYSVPILAALTFTVFGLGFWMSSLEKREIDPFDAFLGSLCMALVAGCRPQLLLVSAMAIIIFWSAVFKERLLFSKKSIFSTVAICLPYVVVAIGIMWYNAARFGSPFDFGANYNLTTNDMTGRGYRVERVGLSVFTYLFQPPYFIARFPFLRSVNIDTGYMGQTITEPMFGGIFAVIPLLWLMFLLPRYSKYMKKAKIFSFACLSFALSAFIAMFDAQGAGLLQRYVNDFSFLAILGAIAIALTMLSVNRTSGSLRTRSFLRFSLFGSGAYCAMIVFAKYGTEIYYQNPYLFNKVAELVEFW